MANKARRPASYAALVGALIVGAAVGALLGHGLSRPTLAESRHSANVGAIENVAGNRFSASEGDQLTARQLEARIARIEGKMLNASAEGETNSAADRAEAPEDIEAERARKRDEFRALEQRFTAELSTTAPNRLAVKDEVVIQRADGSERASHE